MNLKTLLVQNQLTLSINKIVYIAKHINMKQNKANCLYCFIKEQVKLKGHPLKIISDYDECLQPVNPFIWHKLAKEQG
jgi:hypothetical protein